MKNKLLIALIVVLCVCCQNKHETKGYFVNGVVKDMPDGTDVVMYFSNDSIIDTTSVFKGQFQFKGTVDRPRRVMLRMESTGDRKMFWLENQQINIVGEKGDFFNSKVTGSKTQKEADSLKTRKDSIFKEMKRINDMVTENNKDSLFVVYNEMINNEIEINKGFIKDYPNSYESLTVLNFGTKEKLGAEETAKLFSLLNKELQET